MFVYGYVVEVKSGGEISSTNNRMELTAVNEALAMCKDGEECIIYTDSKLTLNCAKGIWKRKSNLDLWDIFDICSKNINIKWEWVKSHSTNDINNLVDQMARNEAKLINQSKIFFNYPRWVVFYSKSMFYNSKTMVLEDSGLQKSMQINQKYVRKQGPKKVCGIKRKRIQMESKSVPEIVNISKNIRKKAF